jgi:DNA-3-methyladenine glycosylase
VAAKSSTEIKRIARSSAPKDTVALARWLLGKVLVRSFRGQPITGRIVETEAYLQHDPACHGFRGITPRTRSLFLERGHAYVYLCYGTSYMLNMSSESHGIGTGVLLRALEPLQGLAYMGRGRAHVRPADLARGPGRLTAAFGVNLRHDGEDLFRGKQLWIGSDGHRVAAVGQSVRIGLTKGADERLRYFVAGSPFLSGRSHLNR